MANIRKKWILCVIAILVTLWLPLSLIINPGWGSFIIFSPVILLCLATFIPLQAIKKYPNKIVPPAVFWSQITFYFIWSSLGLFYINGGDTQESVGSIFSNLFGGIFDKQVLIAVSQYLFVQSLIMSVVLCLVSVQIAAVAEKETYKLSKKHLLVILLLVVVISVLHLAAVDLIAKNRFNSMNNAMETVRHGVMDKNDAIERGDKTKMVGNGFVDSLHCYPQAECPLVERTWLVPLELGQEQATLTKAFESIGYTIDPDTPKNVPPCVVDDIPECLIWGRDKLEIWVNFKKIDPADMPHRDVGPKIWRQVSVRFRN